MVLYFDFVTWIMLMSGAKRPGVSFSQEEQLDSIPWYKHQNTWWDSSSSLPEGFKGTVGGGATVMGWREWIMKDAQAANPAILLEKKEMTLSLGKGNKDFLMVTS